MFAGRLEVEAGCLRLRYIFHWSFGAGSFVGIAELASGLAFARNRESAWEGWIMEGYGKAGRSHCTGTFFKYAGVHVK